jgi:hypothetical protein
MTDFKKYGSKQRPGDISSCPSAAKGFASQTGNYEKITNKITEIRDVPSDTGYISEAFFKEVVDGIAAAAGIAPVYPTGIPALALMDSNFALKDKVDDEFLTDIN